MNSNDKSRQPAQALIETGTVSAPVGMLSGNSQAGLLSAPAITAILDTHGTSQIVGNGGTLDDPHPQFRGRGEPGSVVTIYDNGQLLGEALVNKSGSWSLQVQFYSPIEPGEHAFTVVSATGERSEAFNVTVTALDVAQPVIGAVYDNVGETGVIISDGTTDDDTPTFTGMGEPGTYVYLYENNEVISRTLVKADGSWSIDSDPLQPGQHTFTVRAHGGDHSPPFVLNVSTVVENPSTAPVIESIYDDVGQTGIVLSGGSTDDNTPSFSGTGEPGIRIHLFEGSTRIASTLVDADGTWTISGQALLAPGDHVFTLVDNNGQRSEPFALNVNERIDGKPVIESVHDDVGQTGTVISGGSTDDNTPSFSGTGEPGIRIYLFEGNTRLASTLVKADGTWTISGQVLLAPGNHVFTLMDNNGQRSEPFELNVTDQIDGRPVIDSAVDNIGTDMGLIGSGATTDDARPTILGHGEPNTWVTLYVDGRYATSAMVAADGTWSLLSPRELTPGEHVFTVRSDTAQSEPFVLTVSDVPQAATLVIDTALDQTGAITGVIGDGSSTDEHQPVFQGRGEPDAPVFLFVNNGTGNLLVGSGVVQPDGTWEVAVSRHISVASGSNVFTVSDGVSESAPFTLHIRNDVAAAHDEAALAGLSLADLLQDASGELFATDGMLLASGDVPPDLDLSVEMQTDGGVSLWVAAASTIQEPELTYAA